MRKLLLVASVILCSGAALVWDRYDQVVARAPGERVELPSAPFPGSRTLDLPRREEARFGHPDEIVFEIGAGGWAAWDVSSDAPTTEPGATPPPPWMGSDGSVAHHVVEPGETLSEIALRYYGTSALWPDLARRNAIRPAEARSVRAGTRLSLPPLGGRRPAVLDQDAERRRSSKVYVVRKDDTLYDIARRCLGDGERWRELLHLNPLRDPSDLTVGQRLVLPDS